MIHSRSQPIRDEAGICKKARDRWVGGKQIPEGSDALTKPLWYSHPSVNLQRWDMPRESDKERDHSAAPSLSFLCLRE